MDRGENRQYIWNYHAAGDLMTTSILLSDHLVNLEGLTNMQKISILNPGVPDGRRAEPDHVGNLSCGCFFPFLHQVV